MANLMIRIVTLATCSIALIAAFSVTPAVAAPGTEPGGSEADYSGTGQRSAYPPSSYPKRSGNKATHAPKAKKAKQSLFDDPAFAHGYRAAYSAVYDRTDYASAIEQLKTLGHDDHPNVANLIGYSYRKLGDYRQSQALVRARAEGRSEPCADLAILRSMAARAGQPRSSAISFESDRGDLRDWLRGVPVVGRRARETARH